MPKKTESMPPDRDYVDVDTTLYEAWRDLDPADFQDLMVELGRKLQGPEEKPVEKQVPAMSREQRIEAIRSRMRALFNAGHRLNPSGASPFYREMSRQRLMGRGTGEAAAALAERIRRGQL